MLFAEIVRPSRLTVEAHGAEPNAVFHAVEAEPIDAAPCDGFAHRPAEQAKVRDDLGPLVSGGQRKTAQRKALGCLERYPSGPQQTEIRRVDIRCALCDVVAASWRRIGSNFSAAIERGPSIG